MAVASYTDDLGRNWGPKEIPAPARADLKHWYKSVRKSMSMLPEWSERYRQCVTVDEELIVFEGVSFKGILYIARKKHLR